MGLWTYRGKAWKVNRNAPLLFGRLCAWNELYTSLRPIASSGQHFLTGKCPANHHYWWETVITRCFYSDLLLTVDCTG